MGDVQKTDDEVEKGRKSIAQLQAELETLRAASAEQRAAADKAKHDACQEISAVHAKEAKRADAKMAKAQTSIAQLQAELETLRSASAEHEAAGEEARNELEELRTLQAQSAQKAKAEASKSRNVVLQLQADLSSALTEHEAAAESAKQAAAEAARVLEEKSRLELELEVLRAASSESKAAVDADGESLPHPVELDLHSQLKDAVLAQLKDSAEKTEHELASLRQQLNDANATISRLRSTTYREIEESASLREKLAKLQTEVNVHMRGQKRPASEGLMPMVSDFVKRRSR